MSNPMFCYQCEQTARGTGCTAIGMCGKDSRVSGLQDLLVYQLQGLAYYADRLISGGQAVSPDVHFLTINSLFSTLTNVSFDSAQFVAQLRQIQETKGALRARARMSVSAPVAAKYDLPAAEGAIEMDAARVNIRPQAESDPDVQWLKDTLLYGLRGMAAYAHHAWVLGYRDEQVNNWLYKGLSAVLDESLALPDMVGLLMEFGKVNLRCLELLDRANTGVYGTPQPTYVSTAKVRGPFIVVSGHDLRDLAELLEQTAGKGVNIYTHVEMLPAHGYPELRKYPHLVGNFGGAWQLQQRDFDGLPGAILMTTNCLIEPRDSYMDRIFTTSVVGWPGVAHIPQANGKKDFAPVIEKALALGGWKEDEPGKALLTGFGHGSVLANAGAIVDAVKAGAIKHFFLIGGCDGAKVGRNYYSEFAESTPADTLMLTLGCGKYRINDGDYGTIGAFPRLLDMGQCNDAYSAIRVAVALAEAFGCGVNDLPLTLVLSWFEQKAVCILLTLLSLGIKNIHIGPSVPAFLSPNVVAYLVEQFNLRPIGTPAEDMARMLN